MMLNNGSDTLDAVGFISGLWIASERAPRVDVTLERHPYGTSPVMRDLSLDEIEELPEEPQ